MRNPILLIIALAHGLWLTRGSAQSTESVSSNFELDLREDSAATAEAYSQFFPLDLTYDAASAEGESNQFQLDARLLRGGTASGVSSTFSLSLRAVGGRALKISGPESVESGSSASYSVQWTRGNISADVTAEARWRFLTGAPGNTGMVPPVFYAGRTQTPTAVRIVASFLDPEGTSVESEPFTITIRPRFVAGLSATTGPDGKTKISAGGGAGSLTYQWDADGDGDFNDGNGPDLVTDPKGRTGTTRVTVQISNAAGTQQTETIPIVINKAPAVGQPVAMKPAWDPVQLKFGLATGGGTVPFQFNSGDEDRTSTGLVVIVHGIRQNYGAHWMRAMSLAVNQRCRIGGMIPPNVTLVDWSELADDPPLIPLRLEYLRLPLSIQLLLGASGAQDFLLDVWESRECSHAAGQELADWIYTRSDKYSTGPIKSDRPIHLIGHSAGGFVVGEAAMLLKHRQAERAITVDRVTMLDTPFPFALHLGGSDGYPNPGVVERFSSSWFGDLDAWGEDYPHTGPYFRKENVGSVQLNPLSAHSEAHSWYTDTIWGSEPGGFEDSPILSGKKVTAAPGPAPGAPEKNEVDDLPLGEWETFGSVEKTEDGFTLRESDDAGLWKTIDFPADTKNLSFQFMFTRPGDGDFLCVHYGNESVIYRGLDLPFSRDGWVPVDLALPLRGAETEKLIITLVSRGTANAEARISNLRVSRSEDVDNDGLTESDETRLGTNPRAPDTDGDGLSDGDEHGTHHTSPLTPDTDADGQTDAAELASGYDPLDADSVFKVSSVRMNSDGTVALRWNALANRRYRIVRARDFGSGNFQILGEVEGGGNEPMEYVDRSPDVEKSFYWLEMPEP